MKILFSEILREAQGSLWEVSGTCLEMFDESVKSKILDIFFLKSPFYTSHSRGNLVDGLPRGVSTEAMSASWIFRGGATIDKNDLLGLMFWVVCDIHVLVNF